MKTYSKLYHRIIEFKNLLSAAQKAQKGKRTNPAVAAFNFNLEHELIRLRAELDGKLYCHGSYREFKIYDPKKRLISAAPYRDRVVHHALCNIIEPLFDRSFIYDTYACRRGKGMHAAIDRYQSFCRKNKYVLKCDLKKYFASIDHEILLRQLEKKIRCSPTRWLIREIIGSGNTHSGSVYFPGDNLFTPFSRVKGLPLGNLTSQFFGNLYLNDFDHFIKEKLRCRHYIRYVDDFVIFGKTKSGLHQIRERIEKYLISLRLELHERKTRIYKVKEGPVFLGFRIFPTHRRLDKRNTLRMRRRMKTMQKAYGAGKMGAEKIRQRIRSWIGHAKHGDTFYLRQRVISSVPFIRGETKSDQRGRLEQPTR